MDNRFTRFTITDPSVPDQDISSVEIQTNSAKHRKSVRARRFLKGPIPLSWLREHVQCPTDRLLLVLVARSHMRGETEFKVSRDILREAGIHDRKAAYRAIAKLEGTGSISVLRKRGRRPVVQVSKLLPPEPTRRT
jgi:hypothetical protein